MTTVQINTKLGKVCEPENAKICSVAILRSVGHGSVLAATNGRALAVVMAQMADDPDVPRAQLPQRIPAGLCTGSAKKPNIIKIGAGVNRSLFGPEMVAVSNSLGRFGPVQDSVPFPPVGDAMPQVDDEWVCIEVNVQQLLELVHAITTSDHEGGPHTVLLGVHHTMGSVVVQGDEGGGVLMVDQRTPQDLALYRLLRKAVQNQPSHQSDRAAEIAERIKAGHSATPTTHPASLAGMSEDQVFDLLLVDLPGMNAAAANRLSDAGIATIREYAARAGKPGGIRSVKGIGEAKAERLEDVVNSVWARWKKDNTAPA